MEAKKTFWNNRNFWMASMIGLTAGFTNQIMILIFPVYVLDQGGSNTITGSMISVMTIVMIITRLLVGNKIDTWGRKQMAVLGCVLYFLNSLGYIFITSIPGLFALRVLNGVTQGIFFPVQPIIVSDSSPEDKLVDALGWFSIICTLPAAIAASVGLAIYNSAGGRGVFALAGAMAGIATVFAVLLKNDYHPEKAEKIEKKNYIKSNINLSVIWPCLFYALISLGNSAISSFLTPCGVERGINNVAMYFTIGTVVTIFFRAITGRIGAKVGNAKLMASGIVFYVVGVLVLVRAYSFALVAVSSVLCTIGWVFASQISQATVLRMVPENKKGVAGNTYMLLGDIGVGVGSFVWGFVSSGAGYGMMFVLAAVVSASALVVQTLKIKDN